MVRAGRVLALAPPPRLTQLLDRQGVTVTDLAHLLEGKDFAAGYAAIAETVLATAAQHPPAVFLSQGSPLLLNGVTRYLVAEAKKRDLTLKVYPAVSPIDAIVADLGIDVGGSGLQTIAARTFAAKPARVTSAMPLLLLQVAGVPGAAESAEAYGPLAQALGAVYSAEQPVTLLNMPGDGHISRATVTVERFGELVPHIDTSSSLFIDAVKRPRVSP
jgi:hypothetical protein